MMILTYLGSVLRLVAAAPMLGHQSQCPQGLWLIGAIQYLGYFRYTGPAGAVWLCYLSLSTYQ